MTWKENNKKKEKSSISYEELKSIVDNYEKINLLGQDSNLRTVLPDASD